MELLPHQDKASKKIRKKLIKKGVCLLAGEPRSGKTLSFIDAAHKMYNRILIITTKKAMPDIIDAVKGYGSDKFDVINYHSCQKMHENEYNCIILDECHNYITGYPKRSAIWQNVFYFTKKRLPIIYSSGTPTPEGYAGLFNMFALSHKSPWSNYKRFTLWHLDYGIPYSIRINMIDIKQYDRTHQQKVKKCIDPFTVKITRKEAGHVYEAKDKLHYIDISKKQSKVTKILNDNLVYESKNYTIMGDTPSALLTKKRQIVGGVVKCDDEKLMVFKNNPKIDYIKKNFDPSNCIILAFFKAEQEMLAEIFPNVGSVTSNAEGVDYSHFENMIIYSMGHAAKTYEQVRVRQLNMFKRKSEVIINFLIIGIDLDVYNAVSKKKNFTSSWYRSNK